VVFQVEAFSINAKAANFLSGLISAGNASLPTGFFVLDSKLHFCDHVPKSFSTKSCIIIWDGESGGTGNTTSAVDSGNGGINFVTSSAPTAATAPTVRAFIEDIDTRSHQDKRFLPKPQLNVGEVHRTTTADRIGVNLESLELNGKDIKLDNECLVVLNSPVQT